MIRHWSQLKGRLRADAGFFGYYVTRMGSFPWGEGQDEGRKKQKNLYLFPLTLALSRRERELLHTRQLKLGLVLRVPLLLET